MKILMVNKFLYYMGGSETYTLKLSHYLEKKGHQVRFFGMEHPENVVAKDDNLVKNIDFHNTSIKKFTYPFKIIYSFEARRKIRKILQEFKPDIVHLNNYNYQLTPSILYEIKKCGIPMVQTVHDTNIVCPNHSLYNYQNQEICEKCMGMNYLHCIKTKCIHGSLVRSTLGAVEGWLYHSLNVYNNIDKFICPSRFIAEKITEFGFKRQNKVVINNFKPDLNYREVEKEDYLLYFGRLSASKGTHTLLDAAKRLKHIKFVVAGQGDFEEELSKCQNISYLGFVKGEKLYDLIAKALFSIYPSEWYENCPMSIIESMALGTPVIASEIGGNRDLLNNGVDGLLFEKGNIDDLVEKIVYLYSDRKKLSQMTRRCKTSSERFSLEEYYLRLMKVYNHCIKKHSVHYLATHFLKKV